MLLERSTWRVAALRWAMLLACAGCWKDKAGPWWSHVDLMLGKIYVCMYMYIHIKREREREEKKTKRKKEKQYMCPHMHAVRAQSTYALFMCAYA